jgi:Uma2 family endonuclease
MAIEQRRTSLDEFLALPEEKPALELEPDGTISRKMSPKGRHVRLQSRMVTLVESATRPRQVAYAFAELRTIFGGAAYVPDVSVYRAERIHWTASGEFPDDFTEPPDVAVEIVSPGQGVNTLVRKCIWYVENGVRLALLVDPGDRSVLLFRPSALPRALRGRDQIDLAEVLPGFNASVDDLFSALKPCDDPLRASRAARS